MNSDSPVAERLTDRDPRIGDLMVFRAAIWKVTEKSMYTNDQGYHCVEWTCYAGQQEAYLLKETEHNLPPRWFFTLTIDEDAVSLPESGALISWVKKNPTAPRPGDLLYRNQNYHFEEEREGLYANENGVREKKSTWDYWDPAHKNNLAVELWVSGELDCYLGFYLDPGDVKWLPKTALGKLADHPSFSSDTYKFLGYGALGAFYLLASAGGVFDEILTFIIGLAVLIGWMIPVMESPKVAAVSLVVAVGLGYVFWSFPPLTTPLGFCALIITPAAMAWFMRQTDHSLADKTARIHIAYATELPLIAIGLANYFTFAPAPHDFGQYCLALMPALIGGLLSWGITLYVFSILEPSDARTPSIDHLVR